MNIRLALLAAGTLLISSACVFHAGHGTPPGGARDRYHVHGVACGHAFVSGRWVPVTRPHIPRPGAGKPHVHAPDCGHVSINGQWVLVEKPDAPSNQPHPTPPGGSSKPHPHGAPPGQTRKEHEHGVDCGHVLVKGKWVRPKLDGEHDKRPKLDKEHGKRGKGKNGK